MTKLTMEDAERLRAKVPYQAKPDIYTDDERFLLDLATRIEGQITADERKAATDKRADQ